MSKLIRKPITVVTKTGMPASFFYRFSRPVEAVQDHWREQGRWWSQEEELHVYKVVSQNTFFELHHRPHSDQWILYRIYE